jgi:SpoIID/LytB domain protein
MRSRRIRTLVASIVSIASIAALIAVVALTPAAAAQEAADPPAGPDVDLGVYGVPLRFHAPDGIVMTLGSDRRLVDTFEVRPHPDGTGLIAIAEMDMEEYIEGIGEMPASWPLEALKAQAVAARTYAWYQINLGSFPRRGVGYDICATTACQVFRGRSVVETPETGQNWQQAVAETQGEVLVYDGDPILARYFSTSGGQTRNNEDVFSREGPFPYLKGRPDPDDAISPLHTWQVDFTREQFDDLLSRGDTLSEVSPVDSVEVVPMGPGVADRVVVTGQNGEEREVTAGQLLAFLNDLAPDVYPGEFPGPRSDGGRLPSTIPSSRYTVEVTDDQIVFDGSGWGHGVGLGQYGAKAKAERGLGYREILGFYYNGLQPETPDALPDRVRVGLADDVGEITVRGDGPLEVTAGGTTVTARALGTWRIADAGDRTARLLAPAGYGAPLVAGPTTSSRSAPLTLETVTLETVVNKASELRLEVTAADGAPVSTRDLGVVDPGRARVPWRPITDDGAPLQAGDYQVALVATDEGANQAGDPVQVRVVGISGADAASSLLPPAVPATEPRSVEPVPVALAVVVGAALGGLLGSTAGRRRKATDDHPTSAPG